MGESEPLLRIRIRSGRSHYFGRWLLLLLRLDLDLVVIVVVAVLVDVLKEQLELLIVRRGEGLDVVGVFQVVLAQLVDIALVELGVLIFVGGLNIRRVVDLFLEFDFRRVLVVVVFLFRNLRVGNAIQLGRLAPHAFSPKKVVFQFWGRSDAEFLLPGAVRLYFFGFFASFDCD